jgi:hypothetical protein
MIRYEGTDQRTVERITRSSKNPATPQTLASQAREKSGNCRVNPEVARSAGPTLLAIFRRSCERHNVWSVV